MPQAPYFCPATPAILPVMATLALIVPAIFALPSASAAPLTNRPLCENWQFRAIAPYNHPEVATWHQAKVPGVVQTDLLANKLIPDPFFRDNESRLQWIGLTDWEYQSTFTLTGEDLRRKHADLVLDGLDTYADVYVNGIEVLHADNMFRQWRLNVKHLLKSGANVLRVVFHSPITTMLPKVKAMPYKLPTVGQVQAIAEEGVATDPYTRKAPYNYGWDWGPRYVTQGIWQPVHLETWDEIRIQNFHVQQGKISQQNANLSADLDLIADEPTTATITVNYEQLIDKSSSAKAITQTVLLDAGRNHIRLPFRLEHPQLWYPLGYGQPSRYAFTALVQIGNRTEAQALLKTGLRSIELRRQKDQYGKSFEFVVNGIPVFAKGADVIPFDSFATQVTPARHRQILQSACDAHMNMVREWGGGYYESDDFYDICDELGLMVWQEFMFGGAMVPGDPAFRENVKQEAIQQVERLRDHPSIVLWCGNNEVEAGWRHWGDRQAFQLTLNGEQRDYVWQSYLLLFNNVLEGVVERLADPVPYWPSSPSANYEEDPDNQQNGDMHYWSVWHALAPIENYNSVTPRFMSEFGFQSFPELNTIRSFAEAGDLKIDSPTMKAHQKNNGGNERILTYMLREYREPKDFPAFVYLSQVQQAEAIKVGAEHFRRSRPRTMGALYWQLNDCWPVASWSSIDYFGRWKALQYYARRFYADLLISPYRHDGTIETYVVSDKLGSTHVKVRTRLLDFHGKQLSERNTECDIPAATSKLVETVDEKKLIGQADANSTVAVFDLIVGGNIVSSNLVFFAPARDLTLPAPTITHAIRKQGEATIATVKSDVLARHVCLSFADTEAKLSDNYFDLLPGQSIDVAVQSSANARELEHALRITNLTDAYASR